MHNKNNKIDFTGQYIYVGIDVHNKQWNVTVCTDEIICKSISIPSDVDNLIRYLNRQYPRAQYKCGYEAGYNGFWLSEALKKQGIECIVINASDIPRKTKDRMRKTDRIDSKNIAVAIRDSTVKGIYIPSREAQENRDVIRLRESLVKKQTRVKNQIKSRLAYYGIKLPDGISDKHWSKNYINWILSNKMVTESGDLTIRIYVEELLTLRAKILEVTKHIRYLSEQIPYKTNAMRLKTIPGISVSSAMIILLELADINRFKDITKLKSYVGLVPGEHSTGERQIMLPMTHHGNSLLRKVLIESSWVAIRYDVGLLYSFKQYCKRMPKNKSIVRIATKLLNRILYLLKTEQDYKLGYP